MQRYVLRRLAQLVPSLLLITFMVFGLMHAIPGDPARMMLGAGEALDEKQLEIVRKEYNLDKPLPVQYALWLARAASGDLGRSTSSQRRVGEEVVHRASVTFQLGVFAWLIGACIALPAGIVSAVYRGRWPDMVVTMGAVGMVAVPGFWLGIMMILLFGVTLGWLPTRGYVPFSEDPVGSLRHMLLPAIALGVTSSALVMRQMRSSLLEVLAQDYIRTAKAKGLARWGVIIGHALRNAMLPVITVAGDQAAGIVNGAVIVETIFGWPGVGKLMIDSIIQRDFAIIQAAIFVTATLIFVMNIAIDLAYAKLDPRVRQG